MWASMTGMAASTALINGSATVDKASAAADFKRARLCIDLSVPNDRPQFETPNPTLRRLFFSVGSDHGHWPKQSGRQKGRVRLIRLYVGEGVLGCARLLVSNEAVHPGVDHFDGDVVRARLQRG